MIKEEYVSFETAKLLKDKGFDEICYLGYNKNGEYVPTCNRTNSQIIQPDFCFICCPTLQMVIKWLREVHKLHIAILWDCGAYIGKESFCYHIDRMSNYEDEGYNKIGFDSSEEAVEAAIKYCLENLI